MDQMGLEGMEKWEHGEVQPCSLRLRRVKPKPAQATGSKRPESRYAKTWAEQKESVKVPQLLLRIWNTDPIKRGKEN